MILVGTSANCEGDCLFLHPLVVANHECVSAFLPCLEMEDSKIQPNDSAAHAAKIMEIADKIQVNWMVLRAVSMYK